LERKAQQEQPVRREFLGQILLQAQRAPLGRKAQQEQLVRRGFLGQIL
jgi:hypothetical protein